MYLLYSCPVGFFPPFAYRVFSFFPFPLQIMNKPVRKWFIISANADCESSLTACSVRKWFIISANADCESAFRGLPSEDFSNKSVCPKN